MTKLAIDVVLLCSGLAFVTALVIAAANAEVTTGPAAGPSVRRATQPIWQYDPNAALSRMQTYAAVKVPGRRRGEIGKRCWRPRIRQCVWSEPEQAGKDLLKER